MPPAQARRSNVACLRCRTQKIRCSGTQPCERCAKRRISCEFDRRDERVTVTRGYLDDLAQRAERSASAPNVNTSSPPPRGMLAGADGANPSLTSSLPLVPIPLTNPLSTGQSTFMPSTDGRMLYLGTSSNWAFARRILSMAHQHIYQSPLPSSFLVFDGCTYDLGWDGRRTADAWPSLALPTHDYATYLINAVRFHCGQLYHLFDEDTFMTHLHDFYAAPSSSPQTTERELWYIHFLLIMAFGKAFVTPKNRGERAPGSDFFVHAIRMLPDAVFLLREPILSTEILCCIALYLQCIDYRLMAHKYIGQALRMSLGQGLHTNMPVHVLGEAVVERSRRVWWTTYVLDREMTSLEGLPQSVHDDDVYQELPTFSESVHQRPAFAMRVRLSRIVTNINRTVYGADGRLDSKFLLSTKNVLADIAAVADELRREFPLNMAKDSGSGVSRTSAHLHLFYHQCIVLATRSLLFCFLTIRLESPESFSTSLNSSQTVRNLMQMCVDSSVQMVTILDCLQGQGLLETFLPFDLESVFMSSVNILVASALDTRFLENRLLWLQKAYSMFDEMIASGNLIAKLERSELRQLDEMLASLSMHEGETSNAGIASAPERNRFGRLQSETLSMATMPTSPSQFTAPDSLPTFSSGWLDDSNLDNLFTTTQIMQVANSIGIGDSEWMSQAITEHSIW